MATRARVDAPGGRCSIRPGALVPTTPARRAAHPLKVTPMPDAHDPALPPAPGGDALPDLPTTIDGVDAEQVRGGTLPRLDLSGDSEDLSAYSNPRDMTVHEPIDWHSKVP